MINDVVTGDNAQTITLIGIAIRARTRAPMQSLSSGEITVEHGVVGDYRGAPGSRQITVLSEASWLQACQSLGCHLSWLTRRANLLIRGREFNADDVGKIIQLGDVRLQITRETDPCHRMDEAFEGLKMALSPHWRGGVCCQVLASGAIAVGDIVRL